MKLDDRKVHLTGLVSWAVLLVPTLIWWRESILWVAFMSLYAIVVGHWGAYEAAKAKDTAENAERQVEDEQAEEGTHRSPEDG